MHSEDFYKKLLLDLVPVAQSYMKINKACQNNLGVTMFHAPWPILIEIFISEAENRPLSASKVGIGSGLPSATTYRHLARLIESGQARCRPDDTDRRRLWVSLSPEVTTTISTYLTALSHIQT